MRACSGTVLSWEGHYDESREQSNQVLAANHDDVAALAALINVEMWSRRPERGAELARDVLRRNPSNTVMMTCLAKALLAMKKDHEAAVELDRISGARPAKSGSGGSAEGHSGSVASVGSKPPAHPGVLQRRTGTLV